VADVRVGIRLAADRPWRFLARHSSSVSVQCGKVKPYK
jgi:3-methyladenine DNA glycosylase Mpg